jgi:hypothetical protein
VFTADGCCQIVFTGATKARHISSSSKSNGHFLTSGTAISTPTPCGTRHALQAEARDKARFAGLVRRHPIERPESTAQDQFSITEN